MPLVTCASRVCTICALASRTLVHEANSARRDNVSTTQQASARPFRRTGVKIEYSGESTAEPLSAVATTPASRTR
ncbi:hypothetical protein LSAT2_010501 [Lamellibrachia satsuma]|nr:hypothetical protein LSAT2_010501 [Lamellibrachia satsuma]